MKLTHHGQEETEHHKEIVVSRERYSHTESKLTEAGDHHDSDTTSSGSNKESRDPLMQVEVLKKREFMC